MSRIQELTLTRLMPSTPGNKHLKATGHLLLIFILPAVLTCMLEYIETLTKWMDEGKCFDVIYCDFAKAFDKVPWERLLAKMVGMGVGGNFLGWVGKEVAYWWETTECCSQWTTVKLGRNPIWSHTRKLSRPSSFPHLHQ